MRLLEITAKNLDKKLIKHDYMAGVEGGKITILGTESVYSRYDGIIPLLVRRLEKEGFDIRLIADGLAQPLNHSNTKGRNSLKKQDLLVEVSAAHPSKVMTICDALEISFAKQGRPILVDLMVDQLHQALGRSQGYRFEGAECVALVPANMHSVLLENARYSYDEENSVLIDRTADMGRMDSRLSETATPLVQAIEQFLNNFDRYVQDKRKVIPDVRHVLEHTRSVRERETFACRLLHALTTLSGVERFDLPPTSEDLSQPLYPQYRDIVDAILEVFPLMEDRDRLWNLYRKRRELPVIRQDDEESELEIGKII
jgi:hypothetical protein